MTNDSKNFDKETDFTKNPLHNKNPRSTGIACFPGGFKEDEEFCIEYAESLVEGDIRPLVLKDYIGEKR